MTGTIHHRRLDAAFRGSGALLLLMAGLAVRELLRRVVAEGPAFPGAVAYLCAAVGFLAGCVGAALLVLGAHLLDPVPVSRRWR